MPKPDLPVPWVALWSDEQAGMQAAYERYAERTGGQAQVSLHITDNGSFVQYPNDFPNMVDIDGVTWNDPPQQMTGKPDFGQIHTARHRDSVMNRRCQVCSLNVGSDPLRYVTSAAVDPDLSITMDAPTCPRCYERSIRLCPHLRDVDRAEYLVRAWRPYGVMCRVKKIAPTPGATASELVAWVPFDNYTLEKRRLFIAGQALVEFTDYERIA